MEISSWEWLSCRLSPMRTNENFIVFIQKCVVYSEGHVWGTESPMALELLWGLCVCLILIYPTAPANYFGRMGCPNPSLPGRLPIEEKGLLPSCPMSSCRILKLTQSGVENCFPFQYANKNKILSMDVHRGRILLQLSLLMSYSVMRARSAHDICVLVKV